MLFLIGHSYFDHTHNDYSGGETLYQPDISTDLKERLRGFLGSEFAWHQIESPKQKKGRFTGGHVVKVAYQVLVVKCRACEFPYSTENF